MIRKALISALKQLFKKGNLIATFADGNTMTIGDGAGDPVHIHFVTSRAERKMLFNPSLGLPESYMDQEVEFVEGDVYALIELLFVRNRRPGATTPLYRALDKIAFISRRWKQRNTLRRSEQNVAHHYDLNVELYDLFLDSDRQYSCAYFAEGNTDLAEAQSAKKRHLVAKLAVPPEANVLDIGCGYGGMGLFLAKSYDAAVTGVTLSEEQHRIAVARAEDAEVAKKPQFLLQDYRKLDQKFDRIISVGMFEHVGIDHFKEFFEKCYRLLDDDGVFVLHSIGRHDGPGYTHPFIQKYIFPGGYIPALSEVIPVIENAGFQITDIEILRLHYAETLKAWRQNFMANREQAKALYDEKFCRMWEFYLAGSESAFRHQVMMNFQIQLTKKQTTLPITRDYMSHEEQRLQKPG